MKNVQTLSVVLGKTNECNANCPFCVSKITGTHMLEGYTCDRLDEAARYAVACGAKTAIITSKGDPTHFSKPNYEFSDRYNIYDLERTIDVLRKHFPIIELNTNAINVFEPYEEGGLEFKQYIHDVFDKHPIETLIISAVHYETKYNRQLISKKYHDMYDMIDNIYTHGPVTPRISCIGINGLIDSYEKIIEFANFLKSIDGGLNGGFTQFTWRPVWLPKNHKKYNSYTIDKKDILRIEKEFLKHDVILKTPNHTVYDIDGQNVCITNCLTDDSKDEEYTRQLIYAPNGHLYYNWTSPAAYIF